jgi:phosphatidate cytidylyltransferase
MSAWSDINCDPVNPVFTAVPWNLPETVISIIKTLVSK